MSHRGGMLASGTPNVPRLAQGYSTSGKVQRGGWNHRGRVPDGACDVVPPGVGPTMPLNVAGCAAKQSGAQEPQAAHSSARVVTWAELSGHASQGRRAGC
eukprot:gene19159-biopygen12998